MLPSNEAALDVVMEAATSNDRILAGFAGSAADSFALFSRFEAKLEQYRGNLDRSAVELAKDWRTDRLLRRLEAMLIVADRKTTFLLSGTGDLIEPDDGIVAIGSLLLFWFLRPERELVGAIARARLFHFGTGERAHARDFAVATGSPAAVGRRCAAHASIPPARR